MPLLSKWYARLSLRTKATGISLLITAGSLTVVATTEILQIQRQIDTEQRRSANSVALGFARAAEQAMGAGDDRELTRLANSFLRDGNVLFIAAYGRGRARPIASAVRDRDAYAHFLAGRLDLNGCALGTSMIEAPSQGDEIGDGGASEGGDAPFVKPSAKIGRVAIGLSTSNSRVSLQDQIRSTVAVTTTSAAIGSLVLFVTLGLWLRRLDRLSAASQAISRGDFDAPVGEAADGNRDDEIGRLAHSFEAMRQALGERDGRLRHFTDTLQQQVQQRTADLEKALGAAEEASRAKTMFLANMSHELRTPLNGVIGMVDLLLKTRPDATQRRYCDVAKASAHSLLELINDVLDFSKIEAGKLELDSTDFDLHEVMETVVQIVGPRAAERKLELSCRAGDSVPRRVSGDPVRFRQVLMNLATNAVKFTHEGGVRVTAELVEDGPGERATVRFAVQDSGIGIPRDRLDRLFKSFSQVDASTTRKFGGTGLGLAISQRIVGLMGGQIGVESTPGKGSTFWFTAKFARRPELPGGATPVAATAAAPASAAVAGTPQELAGVRVLLAEDNEINRLVASELLEMAGATCTMVVNGGEAVDAAIGEGPTGRLFDVILMDCQMPEMDGFEATRRIREAEVIAGGKPRVIIALTANAIKGDRERCLAAGMDDYVTKPIDPPALFKAIRARLNQGAQPPAVAPGHSPALPLQRQGPREDLVKPVSVPAPAPQQPEPVPVDVASLRQRCLGNRKVAAKALSKFGEAVGAYVQAVAEGFGQGNAPSVAAAAHKIKGAAGNVSAERVRSIAAELEQLARDDALESVGPSLDALRQEVDRVRQYLGTALAQLETPADVAPTGKGV